MSDKNLRLRVLLELADKALGPLKRISQGSNETAATLKAAREQLAQLNAAQKNLGGFREASAGLAETEAKLKAARAGLAQLESGFAQSGPPTKAFADKLTKAHAEANKLGAQFNAQQQKVQKLGASLSAAGVDTNQLAAGEQLLQKRMAATTLEVTQQTAALKAQADMQRRAAGIKAAQDANAGARANARGQLLDGVALAATLGAPIKMAMDWEQRLAELNKVANKTPQELSAIANAAQNLAVETGVAREEIIGAYIAASQAGFAESEWAQFAEVSAKMGVAFDTTGEKAGDMLKAWRSGMNLSMDQAAALAGAVNHIANNMNASAMDIGDVLQRQGAVMKNMGLSDTQSAALAATMLSGGATSEIAATASKNFMGALTKGFAATKGQREIWDMIGMNPEKVAKDMQKAPQETVTAVLGALQKLEQHELPAAIGMLFGQESVGAASQIVGNIDGLLKAFDLAGDSAQTLGSLQAEFDSMGNTTQQQMKKAGEGVKVVTTALGAGLLPSINASLAAFAPMALGVGQWMQANQGLVTTVVAIIAALMAFKIAAIAGAYAFTFLKGAWLSGKMALFTLRTNLPMISAGLNSAKAAALTAGKAVPLALTRMGLAIKGLPAMFLALGKSVPGGLAMAATAAKTGASQMWAYVLSLKAATVATLRQKVASIAMYATMRGGKGVLADAVLGMRNMAAGGLRGGIALLAGAFKGLWGMVTLVGRAMLLNPMGLAVTAIVGAAFLIMKYWQPIKAFFSGMWQGFVQGLAPIAPAFQAAFAAFAPVINAVRPVFDWLLGALSAAWQWLSRLFAPVNATAQSLQNATAAGQGFGLWLGNLVASLVTIIPRFFTFGAEIVSGIIGGITSKLAALKDTVLGVASSIAKSFKEKLGIASPSKVFTEFGGWISEGAANGIAAGQAGVRTAALAMAGAALVPVAQANVDAPAATPTPMAAGAAIAPSVAASAPAAPAGGNTYTITIQAAPGMDPQAIARAVGAELDRREREAGARRRGALSDID